MPRKDSIYRYHLKYHPSAQAEQAEQEEQKEELNMKKRVGAKNLKIGEQDEQGGCWYRLRVIVAFKKKARNTYSSDWEVHYIETRAHAGHEAIEKVRRLFNKNHWIGDDTRFEIVDADDRHFLA